MDYQSVSKKHLSWFSPQKTKKVKLDIKIGIDCIKESEEIRFLGVSIDNKLNFTPHFNKVYDKVKKGLNGLIMEKNQLNQTAKLNDHSLIHSHLDYCAMIWISNIKKTSWICWKLSKKKLSE